MVQMQTPLQAALAAQLTSENVSQRSVAKAVEVMVGAGATKDDMVTALLAWASTIARSTGDPEFWQIAFHSAADMLAEEQEPDGDRS